METRFRPSWIAAVVVSALFFISQFVWGRVLGVDYETIPDSTENLLTGAVFRVGLTALIFTVIAIYLNRTWGEIYVQKVPRLPWWMWIVPILMAGGAVMRIAGNDWDARGTEYMLVLGIGMLLVGIAEETTFRGIVVRALRGSTSNEFVVMLISSILFGVIHGVNILNGAEVGDTVTQITGAMILGVAFYITLRLVGNVFVPMLLHALVDFSILGEIGEPSSLSENAALLNLLLWVVLAIAAIVILVSSLRNRNRTEQHDSVTT